MARAHSLHDESISLVSATPAALFDYLDDQRRLSAHMSESSWMMLGSRMTIATDAAGGRRVGSRIELGGSLLGIPLHAEGVVTRHEPPFRKEWETVGDPRLLVIGAYAMGVDIATGAGGSRLRVFIDYTLPDRGVARWLGKLLGRVYARWCTRRMAADAARHFAPQESATHSGTVAAPTPPAA